VQETEKRKFFFSCYSKLGINQVSMHGLCLTWTERGLCIPNKLTCNFISLQSPAVFSMQYHLKVDISSHIYCFACTIWIRDFWL